MSLEDIAPGSTGSEQTDSSAEQSKTLIANVYSNRGESDPDAYRELDDWEVSDEDIQLAFNVTAGTRNGMVRNYLKGTPSGSHEEWYCEFQVALAHRIGQLQGLETLPDGREVEGAVPVMDLLSIHGEDIMDYLRENPRFIEELDSEELAELQQEKEPAEADD